MQALLQDGGRDWSAQMLHDARQAALALLNGTGTRVLATLLDNSAAFVVIDEACAQAEVIHSPLPLFF
jgi:hypothetical protein